MKNQKNLVTKEYLKRVLDQRFTIHTKTLRSEMSEIKTDLCAQMSSMKTELRTEMSVLSTEMSDLRIGLHKDFVDLSKEILTVIDMRFQKNNSELEHRMRVLLEFFGKDSKDALMLAQACNNRVTHIENVLIDKNIMQ